MKRTKEQKAITLIALIITIVVLLILAAVAISSITNDGILSYAQNAAKDYNQAVKDEQAMLDGYLEYLEGSVKIVDKDGNDLRNKKVTSNTEVYDKYGNKIVIPAGFKIRVDNTTNNADTVTEGIVIEDESGNQFVWIPIGKIYTDTDKTEENAKNITLGRYSWSGSTGTLMQPIEGYPYTSDEIEASYKEYQSTSTTTNSKARNISDFYESATGNGGYYLGRYEAGDSSNTAVANRTGTNGTSTAGTLVCKANQVPYNWIIQPDASSKCQSMYADGYSSGTFSSDLINSYAWDTAIIFIQIFGTKSNSATYASTIGQSSVSTTEPQATGTNILSVNSGLDEQLNIYDMAGNCKEWTTETYKTESLSCTERGGRYNNNEEYCTTAYRNICGHNYSYEGGAFRPLLYVAQ